MSHIIDFPFSCGSRVQIRRGNAVFAGKMNNRKVRILPARIFIFGLEEKSFQSYGNSLSNDLSPIIKLRSRNQLPNLQTDMSMTRFFSQ